MQFISMRLSPGGGNESFTENITNRELYSENQAQCDSNYDAFKEAARAAVTQMNAVRDYKEA